MEKDNNKKLCCYLMACSDLICFVGGSLLLSLHWCSMCRLLWMSNLFRTAPNCIRICPSLLVLRMLWK